MNSILLLSILSPLTPIVSAEITHWGEVTKSPLKSGINFTGRVVPQDGALNIESARVPGRILSILRREGEKVEEGTPLFSISSAECFSLIEERRVATSKKIDELIQGIEKREKQLGLKLENDQCYAVATHAGVLTKRNLESGASFNSGDSLATVLDTQRLMIEIDIPERDQASVKVGQKVNFHFASEPHQTYSTRIETVVPTIDPQTRTSKARLIPTRFPKQMSLETLVFGEVDIGHPETILKVPTSALVFSHNQQYIISGTEQKPRSVPVQVVGESDNQTSIRPQNSADLQAGDPVAVKDALFIFKRIATEGRQ